MSTKKASIDNLAPTRGLIDLSAHSQGESPLMEGYTLEKVYDDIILVKPLDESEDGDAILKGGVYVPKNAVSQAWRIGKVLLKGPGAVNVKVGDCVIFPNDRGLNVKNMEVAGVGKVKSGMFLNEQRLFGTCSPNEDSSTNS
jgi:hypothetical protein